MPSADEAHQEQHDPLEGEKQRAGERQTVHRRATFPRCGEQAVVRHQQDKSGQASGRHHTLQKSAEFDAQAPEALSPPILLQHGPPYEANPHHQSAHLQTTYEGMQQLGIGCALCEKLRP